LDKGVELVLQDSRERLGDLVRLLARRKGRVGDYCLDAAIVDQLVSDLVLAGGLSHVQVQRKQLIHFLNHAVPKVFARLASPQLVVMKLL
jgi:hypothetical protein